MGTFLEKLNYQHVHKGIFFWVACPSMHCAHAFSIAAAFKLQRLQGQKAVGILAYITLFSTCLTGAHPPPHLLLGVLLGLSIHNFVLKPLESRNALNSSSSATASLRFFLLAVAPFAFHFAGDKLSELSGWKTDIPSMLGLISTP